MEYIENPEMVKMEIEISKEQAEFAEFYAKICNMETGRMLGIILATQLNTYKKKVFELPLITIERSKKTKKNWQI